MPRYFCKIQSTRAPETESIIKLSVGGVGYRSYHFTRLFRLCRAFCSFRSRFVRKTVPTIKGSGYCDAVVTPLQRNWNNSQIVEMPADYCDRLTIKSQLLKAWCPVFKRELDHLIHWNGGLRLTMGHGSLDATSSLSLSPLDLIILLLYRGLICYVFHLKQGQGCSTYHSFKVSIPFHLLKFSLWVKMVSLYHSIDSTATIIMHDEYVRIDTTR